MEFLLGFFAGVVCLVILLVQWRKRHTAASAQPSASPTDTKQQSYEGVIADLEEQSDNFLREFHETISTYPRKRR